MSFGKVSLIRSKYVNSYVHVLRETIVCIIPPTYLLNGSNANEFIY